MFDASFWSFVGLILFFLLLIFMGVPGRITKGLDGRAARIREDLDEARKLREEAQALLASYQRKQRDAEATAEEIVEAARAEAKRFQEEARTQMAEQVERRTAMAESKIAQAEREAVSEVRDVAVSLAIAGAERLIREKVGATEDAALIDRDLGELKEKLH